jgi:hypothetical protein
MDPLDAIIDAAYRQWIIDTATVLFQDLRDAQTDGDIDVAKEKCGHGFRAAKKARLLAIDLLEHA